MNIIQKPNFPVAIDSTMRAEFILCPLKFYRRFVLNLIPKGAVNLDTHAGAAFAKGLEKARMAFHGSGLSKDQALEIGCYELIKAWGDFDESPDEQKNMPNMLGALVSYLDTYPLDSDPLVPIMSHAGPMVEFSFALPLEDVKHPQTGEPIIYFGRADMVAELGRGSGLNFVVDEKTTKALGARWASQWEMRAQMTGYAWAGREYGYDVQGAIIRGVSILKESYGHVEAITYRQDWEIKRWYGQLVRDIKRMISSWEEGYWDYALDTACSMFSPCMYLPLCDVEKPEEWLNDYEERIWNPLTKD